MTEQIEVAELDDDALSGAIEALLLMATEPMPAVELAQALKAPVTRVEATLASLVRFYIETKRGFELRHAGGGWRYATRPYFLERMGLTSLDDLPPLAPHLPDATTLEAELLAATQPMSSSISPEEPHDPDNA